MSPTTELMPRLKLPTAMRDPTPEEPPPPALLQSLVDADAHQREETRRLRSRRSEEPESVDVQPRERLPRSQRSQRLLVSRSARASVLARRPTTTTRTIRETRHQ
ncbi:hypothetical protein L3Y34_017149 [Caenorhabditis briggsae]|uniref:Uncharacterized protein n=1 Tax=Caenorhabditis briggsae TaxID=6238 RepID=A0AAE9DGP4_CAEBR|nr:hypothetical protein L3Y34_017149 [Caenorhabditis briggsae]